MSDRRAFLDAIAANPDDDTARLVFADWLDENGNPDRAEFIRVQIELEPIRHRADVPRALELHRREDELLHALRDRLPVFDSRFDEDSDFGPVFRRGFAHSVCWSVDTLGRHGLRLMAECPTVREVALLGVANHGEGLIGHPLLETLDTLEIADWPTLHDALACAADLEGIPRLRLWVGGEMWLLDHIARRRTADWPHEIELVQVYGGYACDADTADELDAAADRTALRLNEQFGREVAHVTRPFDRLFPLSGKVGPLIRAGRLPDGKPALVAGSFGQWVLVVFDDSGRVYDVNVHDSPYPAPRSADRYAAAVRKRDDAFHRWVYDSLKLTDGFVRVREFEESGLGVRLWPEFLAGRVGNPSPQAPTEDDELLRRGEYWGWWRARGGDARKWLEDRNFVVSWGRELWADWRGAIRPS